MLDISTISDKRDKNNSNCLSEYKIKLKKARAYYQREVYKYKAHQKDKEVAGKRRYRTVS